MSVNPHKLTRNFDGILDWIRQTFANDTDGLTASKALVTDANGRIVPSTTTATEIGHLSGLTGLPLVASAYGVPLVSAYLSSATAGNFTTATELVLDGEVFDPSTVHSTSTGRTLPTTAGKYAVLVGFLGLNWTLTASLNNRFTIRKNGSVASAGDFTDGLISHGELGATNGQGLAHGLFDMNGSSDYLSLFLEISTDTTVTLSNFANRTFMHVFRVSN